MTRRSRQAGIMSESRPRVLVVDDEPDICWVVRSALAALPCDVVTAMTATDALEELTTSPCALALIDAKLPDLEGLELARRIQERSPATARVLVSAYFSVEDTVVAEALQEGLIAGFVAKPFELYEVRELVRRMLHAQPLRMESGK